MSLALSASACTALLLAGCAAEPLTPDKAEEYSREFIKTFGAFDQSHDWNQATKVSVSVITARPTEIKVYAMVDDTRYLFGTFLNVNGQNTLDIDVPKGTTDLIVRANDMDYNVKAGGAVDLTSRSRYMVGSTDVSSDQGLYWKITPEKGILRTVAAKTYLATYGENDPKNLSKGTNSFYFLADGNEHTFYPFYWYTNAYHILGIFTVNADNPSNITLHDLYYSKTGELEVSTDYSPDESVWHYEGNEQRLFTLRGTTDLPTEGHKQVTYNGRGNWWEEYFSGVGQTETKTVKITDPAIFTTPHGYISSIIHMYYDNDEEYLFYETPTKTYEEKFTFNANAKWNPPSDQPAYTAGENTYVRTKGITYRLEKGTRYGFYIKVKGSKFKEVAGDNTDYEFIVFSNAERNAVPFFHDGVLKNEPVYAHPWSDKSWWATSGAIDKDKFAYASWGTARMLGREYTMFGFEDWPGKTNGTGADLNDIMFLFAAGEQPSTVVDIKELGKTFQWIIACEDLGTDDFDFNDVVFGVGNTVEDKAANKKTVDITALASGGTLPVYLLYKDKIINEEGLDGGEFHKWFDDGKYSSTDAINARTYSSNGKTCTIDVDPNFSLECCKSVSTENGSGNMGGFKVKVIHADGPEIISAANPNLTEEIGTAPQMLCLPGTWLWPQENILITDVYSGFTSWSENQNTHIEWHKDPQGKYVNRTIADTGSGSLSGIGSSSQASSSGEVIAPPQEETINGSYLQTYNWGDTGYLFKYDLSPDLFEGAENVVVTIDFTGSDYFDIYKYGTTGPKLKEFNRSTDFKSSPLTWILTSDNITQIKNDKGFYIMYYNCDDGTSYAPKVTITVTK